MAVKLTMGEPRLIAMGPVYAKVGWGTHQFPSLRYLPDGRIVLSYHIAEDTCEDYGKERAWVVSSDNGETWTEVPDEEIPAIKVCCGVKLPSGKYLKQVTYPPVAIDDELREKLTKKMGKRRNCVPIEDVPDGLFPKTWTLAVSEPGDEKENQYLCDLDFPGMCVHLSKGGIVPPTAFNDVRVAPDGSLWLAVYQNGRNPENLGYTSYSCCYYFQSTDEGKSFKLKSWIPYLPDTNEFPDAFLAEGYDEPDIAFMPDGSMITIMRTSSFTPSYMARSTDGGNTWSKPVRFGHVGVYPQIQRMPNGVTVVVYGRPGLYVRATRDPSGQTWEDPIELMPWKDPVTDPNWEESCYYTSLLPLDDHTILMAYSDFRVPDENGDARKCIFVRTIRVD